MNYSTSNMTNTVTNIASRVWHLYYDGFRSMTIGRTLWIIIIVKVVIFFGIMKLLFFPDLLKTNFDNDEQRAGHVRTQLLKEK